MTESRWFFEHFDTAGTAFGAAGANYLRFWFHFASAFIFF